MDELNKQNGFHTRGRTIISLHFENNINEFHKCLRYRYRLRYRCAKSLAYIEKQTDTVMENPEKSLNL